MMKQIVGGLFSQHIDRVITDIPTVEGEPSRDKIYQYDSERAAVSSAQHVQLLFVSRSL